MPPVPSLRSQNRPYFPGGVHWPAGATDRVNSLKTRSFGICTLLAHHPKHSPGYYDVSAMLRTAMLCSMLMFTQSATPQQAPVPKPPAVVEFVVPGFPQLPSGAREAGEVQIEVSIGPAGNVTAAKAISGPPRLREAALFAARRWSFHTGGKHMQKLDRDIRLHSRQRHR